MPSLEQQLRNCPLEELLQVGLRCARQLQVLYRDWPDAKPADLETIDDVLNLCESSLQSEEIAAALAEACEAAYVATGRAAAAYRISQSIQARLAAFAGMAAYSIADGILDRNTDTHASRQGAMQAVNAAYQAKKLIDDDTVSDSN